MLPEEAYLLTPPPSRRPAEPQHVQIEFDRGVPARLDGAPLDPVALIERLGETAARHGVGRGMHVGDTILGIKGRVAFEAPAAVTLIAAHRELEKLVLSRQQLFWKATLGDLYGAMLHEARFFDPSMRDLEAFLASSQRRVTGSATVRLFQGQATVEGAASPYSLMDRDVAVYGEESSMWSGEEAAAFSKIYGLADVLFHRAAAKGDAACDYGLTRSPRPRGTSPLRREIRVVPEITAEEGYIVAARACGEKSVYNQLEDMHGRMVTLHDGDVIVGVLGHRNALHGYSGVVPEAVTVGQRLQLLNLGGVIGQCTSANIDVGPPLDVEVLGAVLTFPDFEDRSRRAGAHPHERHSLFARQSARRAGDLRRRHLHEQRQDQRGVPAGAATGHPRQGRRRLQAHRRFAAARHAADERLRRKVGRLVHRRRHRLDQRRKRRSRSRTG